MIDKPVELNILLSYSQAVMLRKQLEYKINKIQYKQPTNNQDNKKELNTFKQWKEVNKIDDRI